MLDKLINPCDIPLSYEEKTLSMDLANYVLAQCGGKSKRIPLITAHRIFEAIVDVTQKKEDALNISTVLEEIARLLREKTLARFGTDN